MKRWLLAVVLGVSSFLTGAFFEVMSESSRTIDVNKIIGGTAFCRVASDANTIEGLTQSEMEQKNYLQTAQRLVVFKRILSGARRFLVLYSDSSQGAPITVVREAAEKLGIELVRRRIKTVAELMATLEQTTKDKVDGIFHIPDDWVDRHAVLIFKTAKIRKFPTMTFGRVHITEGALASYGSELYQCELRKTLLPDKISMFDSAKDVPLKLIKRAFLEINLKTANEIGFPMPLKVLQRADRIIK